LELGQYNPRTIDWLQQSLEMASRNRLQHIHGKLRPSFVAASALRCCGGDDVSAPHLFPFELSRAQQSEQPRILVYGSQSG